MLNNLQKETFVQKCKDYEKGTAFLRFFVIYGIPTYMIFSIATIIALVINVANFSYTERILISLFELVKFLAMYIVRKEAFLLSKRAYYCLYLVFGFIFITALITEGFNASTLYTGIIVFFCFFAYLYPRSFLFGVD